MVNIHILLQRLGDRGIISLLGLYVASLMSTYNMVYMYHFISLDKEYSVNVPEEL